MKTWSAGEVLTASDLNSEVNNILNNPIDLWSPAGKAADMNGFELILDADADSSITSDTDDRIDFRIAGTDSMFLGQASGNTGGFLTLDPLAFTATASTDIGRMRIGNTNALTVPAGTTAVAASLFVEEPNLTATGTITSAVTLYVEAAPTEGGTNNYALWVDSGTARFDGIINATGGQIAFPATQAASADANTLDDYEEGTWTPSVGGNATYTGQTGTYTKIGREVFIYMDLTINVLGTGSATTVSGLPFTCNASVGGSYVLGFFNSTATNVVYLAGFTAASTSTIVFEGMAAAGASLTGISVFQNAARIVLTGSYQV